MYAQFIPMKFYESKDFIKLQQEWKEKLSQNGFKDIEKGEHLKDGSRRTIAFENREKIHDFFRSIDHFLTKSKTLSPLHRRILELYSDGKFVREICSEVNRGRTTVKGIISYYRKLLTGRL